MRKAQTEIFGLVIITVFIAIAIFIFISLNLKPRQIESSTLQDYQAVETSSNFLLAVLKTTSNCRHMTLEELVEACVLNINVDCPGKPCSVLNESMELIFNDSLKKDHISFNFSISYQDRNYVNISNLGCESGKLDVASPGFYPIPFLNRGNAIVELKICEQ